MKEEEEEGGDGGRGRRNEGGSEEGGGGEGGGGEGGREEGGRDDRLALKEDKEGKSGLYTQRDLREIHITLKTTELKQNNRTDDVTVV